MELTNSLFEKHRDLLNQAIQAVTDRTYYSPYPENPKAYAEGADAAAKAWFAQSLNTDFSFTNSSSEQMVGEEISPYLQVGLGIKYPALSVDIVIQNAQNAQSIWSSLSVHDRTGILMESLEAIKNKFFEIAIATQHTTGQSYMMSFQASGPHSADRALEAIAMGYAELTRFPNEVLWSKNMGKFNLNIQKDFQAFSKGIGLVIGCSTFPVWNTLPGVFANLICGNVCIIKPHAKSVLPIAIAVEAMRSVFHQNGITADCIQLAVDQTEKPITKLLAEHSAIQVIDYTGNSEFGSYLESLPKTVFTEKAGVNNLIIDSVSDIAPVVGNIALSVSLYSGQMCTAPQNIFIPETGIKTQEGHLSYNEVRDAIVKAISDLTHNPKAGPSVLGCIQAEATAIRVDQKQKEFSTVLKGSDKIANEEFPDARTKDPVIIEVSGSDLNAFQQECFGPVGFIIKTKNTDESIALAAQVATQKGALTCGAYTTNVEVQEKVKSVMNRIFIPVSFNFTGAALINSHAAFSDFHLTGGNAAGNASYCNPDFITRRFVWVGNRYMA